MEKFESIAKIGISKLNLLKYGISESLGNTLLFVISKFPLKRIYMHMLKKFLDEKEEFVNIPKITGIALFRQQYRFDEQILNLNNFEGFALDLAPDDYKFLNRYMLWHCNLQLEVYKLVLDSYELNHCSEYDVLLRKKIILEDYIKYYTKNGFNGYLNREDLVNWNKNPILMTLREISEILKLPEESFFKGSR